MPLSPDAVLGSAGAIIDGLGAPPTMQPLLRYPLRKARLQLERNPHWPVLHLPGLLAAAYGLPDSVSTGLRLACLLLYGFADLTDDAQDGDLQEDWGWERAINAGNALAFLGSEVLGGLEVTPEARARLTQAYARAGRKMTFGQEADLLATYPQIPSVDAAMALVAGKSGASVAFFAASAAMAAGAREDEIDHLQQFGEALGISLQILSDASELSRVDSSDLRNRRMTLPLIYGLSLGGAVQATLVRMLEGRGSPADVRDALRDAGASAYCTMKAQVQKRAAMAALAALSLPEETDAQLRAYFEVASPPPGLEI